MALSAAPIRKSSTSSGLDDGGGVDTIDCNLCGREMETGGRAFFIAEFESGRRTAETIAINTLDGAQASTAPVMANAIADADLFTAAPKSCDEVAAHVGTDAAEAWRVFLAGAIGDPDRTPSAEAGLLSLGSAGGALMGHTLMGHRGRSAIRSGPIPRWARGRPRRRSSCLVTPPGRLRSPDRLRRPGPQGTNLSAELTFHPDHPVGTDHSQRRLAVPRVPPTALRLLGRDPVPARDVAHARRSREQSAPSPPQTSIGDPSGPAKPRLSATPYSVDLSNVVPSSSRRTDPVATSAPACDT